MAERLSDAQICRMADDAAIYVPTHDDVKRLRDECLARGEEIAGLTATKDQAVTSAAAYSVRLEAARGLLEEAKGAMPYRRDIAERIAAFLAGKERPA